MECEVGKVATHTWRHMLQYHHPCCSQVAQANKPLQEASAALRVTPQK